MRNGTKERLVQQGRAHASLVFDGEDCVGWCQFGSPAELPCIHNERTYLATIRRFPTGASPASLSAGHRGRGVAHAALAGAVELIATLGRGASRDIP